MGSFECFVHSQVSGKSLVVSKEWTISHLIQDGQSRLDVSSLKMNKSLKFPDLILFIAYSEGILAVAFKNCIQIIRTRLENVSERQSFDVERSHFMVFDSSSSYLAACSDDILHCIHIHSGRKISLIGHASKVTRCEFMGDLSLNGSETWIISISEDRTFKIWSLQDKSCLYQSCILSPHALVALSLDPFWDRMCLANESGQLFFYNLKDKECRGIEPRELKRIDVHKLWNQWNQRFDRAPDDMLESIYSLPSWKVSSSTKSQPSKMHEPASDMMQIHNLNYIVGSKNTNSYCLISCSIGFIIIEPRTFSAIYFFDFLRNKLTTMDCFSHSLGFVNQTYKLGCINSLCHEGSILDLREIQDKNPWTSIGDRLDLNFDEFILKSIENKVQGKWAHKIYQDCLEELSKLGIRHLDQLDSKMCLPDSIPYYVISDLQDYIQLKESNETTPQPIEICLKEADGATHLAKIFSSLSLQSPKKKSKSSLNSMNKPVTFHSKVKSSGYTQPPVVNKLFTIPKSKSKQSCKKNTFKKEESLYPMDCLLINHPYKRNFSITHSSGIMCVRYNSSGRLLGTASADQTGRGYKLSTGHGKDFIGHDAVVQKLMWSHDKHSHYGPLLITASMDSKARIWSMEKSEPLLTLHHVLESPRPGLTENQSKNVTGPVFSHDVKNACFFYQDNFLTILNGPKIFLYNYRIDPPDLQSIRPGFNHNRYKLVKTFEDSTSQSITSIVCANSFKSNYIFGAASDKSLNVWDVETGALISCMENTHTRVIHHLSIADYSFIPNGFENILLSSAVTDGLKAWDLRCQRNVMHFLGHVNRSCPIEANLSPCGRYIASGSEDKCLYIYDFRKGSILSKTSGLHVDTILSCAYHPLTPEIACGSLDGKVSFLRT